MKRFIALFLFVVFMGESIFSLDVYVEAKTTDFDVSKIDKFTYFQVYSGPRIYIEDEKINLDEFFYRYECYANGKEYSFENGNCYSGMDNVITMKKNIKPSITRKLKTSDKSIKINIVQDGKVIYSSQPFKIKVVKKLTPAKNVKINTFKKDKTKKYLSWQRVKNATGYEISTKELVKDYYAYDYETGKHITKFIWTDWSYNNTLFNTYHKNNKCTYGYFDTYIYNVKKVKIRIRPYRNISFIKDGVEIDSKTIYGKWKTVTYKPKICK